MTWSDQRVSLAHGSLHQPEQFHYIVNLAQAELSLKQQQTPVAFVGHTHVPGIFTEQQGKVSFFRRLAVNVERGVKYLVNVGSVGQPRDRDPRAAYCLYDSDAGSIEIRRVDYPVPRAQEKIRRAGLPAFLAERLEMGY